MLCYTASLPTKFIPAPGDSSHIAPDKYAQLGRVIFGGRTPEESRRHFSKPCLSFPWPSSRT